MINFLTQIDFCINVIIKYGNNINQNHNAQQKIAHENNFKFDLKVLLYNTSIMFYYAEGRTSYH